MLSFSPTPLAVEQGVGVVGFLDLLSLALGKNSNLTSNNIDDLWLQGIVVDDENYHAPKNIPYGLSHP